MPATSIVNVKCQLGNSGTFHRFALTDRSFAALSAQLDAVAKGARHWEGRLDAGLNITFTDDENDQCRITNDADVATAIALGGGSLLRLTIRPNSKPPAAAAAPGPVHVRIGMCGLGGGGGGGGGWHRWATQKYGPAPARRLAAAAAIDHKTAVR
eukprot:SAG22_NODE_591_length_8819_cov_3.667737_7_plen_154_part_01